MENDWDLGVRSLLRFVFGLLYFCGCGSFRSSGLLRIRDLGVRGLLCFGFGRLYLLA